MADRPIIFSGAMVRALLDGRKTQTRRLATSPLAKCQPGDRLFVRESYLDIRQFRDAPVFAGISGDAAYMADNTVIGCHKWTPSIHMPRWASRLTLVVTDVRRQMLMEISEDGAVAEGPVKLLASGRYVTTRGEQYFGAATHTAKCWYADLWDRLHNPKGHCPFDNPASWASNPEIVALAFTVHRVNISNLQPA